MNVKEKLAELAKIVDQKLETEWQKELDMDFGFNQKEKDLVRKMLEHAQEHNLRPAKRLRASLVYFGYKLGKKVIDERIWKVAMAVEMVHTALLMHDDVMDEDETRRGKPTTHMYFANGDRHYGEAMACSIGDGVLSTGYQLLLECGFDDEAVNKATRKLLRGIVQTAWGQAFDVSLEKLGKWTEDDVMALHKTKTAIYTYENPLHVGAILAGVDDEVLEILHEYSMDGGVAFQLQDDVLGIYGDPEKTGKSADSDLLQGKCTLLILKALEMGSPEEVEKIKKVWGKRKADKEDIEAAKVAIKESGSFDYSMKLSRELAARAVATAEKLKGRDLDSEAIEYIQGIAQYMVEREV